MDVLGNHAVARQVDHLAGIEVPPRERGIQGEQVDLDPGSHWGSVRLGQSEPRPAVGPDHRAHEPLGHAPVIGRVELLPNGSAALRHDALQRRR